MGTFWLDDCQIHPTSECDCKNLAHELHGTWSQFESFPLFWSLINYDKSKLETIFVFFCDMQRLMSTEQAKSLRVPLENRLFARWDKKTKVAIPSELHIAIEYLSVEQIAAFEKLKNDGLVSSAFELFVTGSLVAKRRQYLTRDISKLLADIESSVDDPRHGKFEPNGYTFFLWAEFALLAMRLGINLEKWMEILPILLRSERILALCWGAPEAGFIPPNRDHSFYNAANFAAIHPCLAKSVAQTSANNIDQLETEATNCARFAFPKNFETEKLQSR